MEISSDWAQLSNSCKQALRFAWAAARERAVGTSILVDSSDLLVGILLAHPGTSLAEQTFRHYGLVAGQVLPDGYPRLTTDMMNRQLATLPFDGSPSVDTHVQNIVQAATRTASTVQTDQIVPLRILWLEMLENDQAPASVQVSTLLSHRGVNASALASQTRAWLSTAKDENSYSEVLKQFPAAAVQVPNFKTDQVDAGAVAPEDFVGVSAEVDAFAYLLASQSLEPPLAIGLFGAWGSGKSYFLDAIQRRIAQLMQSQADRHQAQRGSPFWHRIVQVQFNAWHYVEGDLWSSLVDHIFTQLNLASEKATDNIVIERQRYFLGKLASTAAEVKRLEMERQKLESKLQDHESQVKQVELNRDAALAELRSAQTAKVAAQLLQNSRTAVVDALKGAQLGSKDDDLTVGQAIASLEAAQAELGRADSVLRPFLANPWWVLILALFVVGAPVIALVIESQLHSITGAAMGGVASLVGMGVTALGISSRWVKERLDAIETARQKVDAEFQTAETEWRNRLEQAKSKVQTTEDKLSELKTSQAELTANLTNVEQELQKQPSHLLYEFLRERQAAGDYRKRLGLPAIIRRDFKGLADLISHQNAFLIADDDQKKAAARKAAGGDVLEEDDPKIINRIVLYIDDLDRCPDTKVIEVLQAVHLLLAFPLFVVVVAVDSRWLAHALETRYPALGEPSRNGTTGATPDDYLEKIFQIPFWVASLDDRSRTRIVRGLLGRHVRTDEVAGGAGAQNVAKIGDAEKRVLDQMIEPRSGPPLLDLAALTVTREELDFIDTLAPLMGRTPRAVKRFVNVYQLLKILRHGRATTGAWPPDENLIAFVQVLVEGLPLVGWPLIDRAATTPPTTTLNGLLTELGPRLDAGELARLEGWLAQNGWTSVSAAQLTAVASDVRRFVFRIAPRGAAPQAVPTAQATPAATIQAAPAPAGQAAGVPAAQATTASATP